MAGLSPYGFEPDTLAAIKSRIELALETLNPGFDFSPESPDGQLIGIMSYEIFTLWDQLSQVYQSYNPEQATGDALRNKGLITGIPYGTANRSYATIEFQGTAGVSVPAGSIVEDGESREWFTAYRTVLPSNAQVICKTPGPVPAVAGSVVSMQAQIAGITGITQTTDGVMGKLAMSEQEYINLRSATVMRNYTSTVDVMRGRLLELGLTQVAVNNNDETIAVDGVPANTVAVTIGELGDVTTDSIASVILETIPMGCPTFGTTTVSVKDQQGYSHDVSFTQAVGVPTFVDINLTFLDLDKAGAVDNIRSSVGEYINGLPAGSAVIWSHLFQYITPYANAQVNTLLINKTGDTPAVANLPMTVSEYASITSANITITEV